MGGKVTVIRFPLGLKLFAGFIVMILVTGVIALVSISRLSELGSILKEVPQKELPEVHALWKVRTLLSGMETDLRHVLFDEDRGKYLHYMWKKGKDIQDSLVTYRELHHFMTDEEAQLLEEVNSKYKLLEDLTANLLNLLRQGEESTARALLFGTWEETFQQTVESISRLLDYEDREVEQRVGHAEVASHSARRLIATLAAAGALLSLALALGITLSLTKPISKLIKATERVSERHLVSNAEVVSKDEIGLLARRFNDMLDRLNRSFSDQRRFYADVSHELRTPLTVIRGEAEVALRGPRSAPDYREALESIVSVTNQMGCLVDELLFLARSEAGQIRYEMADIALPSLLEEVARQNEGVAGLKGVRLDVGIDGAVAICGDPQRLRQLVSILLDNAIKYTKAGGKVTIALKAEPDRARVLVSDTGIGMPEDELPHVFERFYRGDSAKMMREEGTGLGLSIAESIVKGHRGQILINSALGRGTTVSVMLPRNPS